MNLNLILLASIGIVSFMAFENRTLFQNLLFNPYTIKRQKQWYRFVSSAWIHADFNHAALNLFVLWMFGATVLSVFQVWFGPSLGPIYYFALFVFSVIAAHVSTYMKHQNNAQYNSIGASGGVAGVLFSSILMDPTMTLLLFLIIPMPAILFGVGYLWYSARMAQKASDNINHEAHLWGAIAGVVFTSIIRPQTWIEFISEIQGAIEQLLN